MMEQTKLTGCGGLRSNGPDMTCRLQRVRSSGPDMTYRLWRVRIGGPNMT